MAVKDSAVDVIPKTGFLFAIFDFSNSVYLSRQDRKRADGEDEIITKVRRKVVDTPLCSGDTQHGNFVREDYLSCAGLLWVNPKALIC